MKVDLLITGAGALTQDAAVPVTDRVAVHQGRIFAVGEDCDGLEATRTIDGGGATLIPGFNDAHAHSVWFGTTLLELDLSGCAGLEDLYARIAGRAEELGAEEWVVASGYNQMDTGGAYPDPEHLDAASGGRPVWMMHTSGHSCIISAQAMRILGVTGRETFEGGTVVRGADGRPTGVLEETAMALVQEFMLPMGTGAIVEALAAAHEVYAAEGITSVTDAGIAGGWIGRSPVELGAYQDALASGALTARSQVMIASDVLGPIGVGERTVHGLDAGIRSGLGDEWLQVGPVKFFLDGSILGNTAKMSQGYANCPTNHGYFQADREVMRGRALAAARSGWALAMHAVGDEAIDLAIEILNHTPAAPPPLPHRIEHGGVLSGAALAALARHGVPIVSQPHFMKVYGDGFRSYIGDERTHRSFPAGSQLRAGLTVAGSSDRPVAPGAPLQVMSSMIHRRTASGWVYGPEERLSPAEALHAYTAGSAHVTGWGRAKGRISPGMLADLVFLDGNPLERDPATLSVLSTITGGRCVFDDDGPCAGMMDP